MSELLEFVRRPNFESEFKAEYDRLTGLDNRYIAARAAKGEAQKWTPGKLNRYGNILPYDRNRVVLKENEVEAGGIIQNCDYINASWIRKVENIHEISASFILADLQRFQGFRSG